MNITRPFSIEESANIFAGTAAESAIDMATFGIAQPDIVPEAVEQEHPYATIAGRIAGSVAGMIPSFGAAGLATRGLGVGTRTLLGAFRFGASIEKAAAGAKAVQTGVRAAQAGTKALRAAQVFSSPMSGGITFAIHDAAREYVRQVKEGDPSTYDIAKTAVGSFTTGAVMGYVGEIAYLSNPAIQASAMGATTALAEAAHDKAAGEDIASEEWILRRGVPSFLMGTAIGLFNSRGYKERQSAELQGRINKLALLKDKSMKEIDPATNKPVYKTWEEELREIDPNIFKDKVASSGVTSALQYVNRLVKKGEGFGATPRGRTRNVHAVLKTKLGMTDDAYRSFIEKSTGKTSSQDLTEAEYNTLFDDVLAYVDTSVANTVKPVRPAGILERIFSPADRVRIVTGAHDLVSVKATESAKSMQLLWNSTAGEAVPAMRKQWTALYDDVAAKGLLTKRTAKSKVARAVGNRADDADELLSQALTKTRGPNEVPLSDDEYAAVMRSLSPEMKTFIEDMRGTMDYFHQRLNDIEKVMQQDLTARRDFYSRSFVDRAAMKRAGRGEELKRISFGPSGESLAVPRNPRVSTQMQRDAKTTMLKVRDPFEALKNMIMLDVKAIYLHQPEKLVEAEVKNLVKQGLMDKLAADDIKWWLTHAVIGTQTPGVQRIDAQINRFLSSSNPGKALDTFLAWAGRDMGGSPYRSIGGLWGSTVTSGYMGGRAKLAIRNAMQWTMLVGFNDPQHIARGMADVVSGGEAALVKEFYGKNLFWRNTTEQAEEHIAAGIKGSIGTSMQQKGHVFGNKVGVNSTFHRVISNINAKGNKYGWATDHGIELRAQAKAAGDKNWKYVLDDVEKSRMFEEMEFVASHTFFLYNVLGMPNVFRGAFAPAAKLMSFPMNYGYKYLSELGTRAWKGKPTWAVKQGVNVKLPMTERAGIFKHAIFVSLLAAAAEAAGFDTSSEIGIGYKKGKGIKGVILPFSEDGILSLRPSPGMGIFMGLKNMMSGDENKRAYGRYMIKNSFPYPGQYAKRDIEKVLETGDVPGFLFYRPSDKKNPQAFTSPKRRKRATPFGGFEGFGGTGGFGSF